MATLEERTAGGGSPTEILARWRDAERDLSRLDPDDPAWETAAELADGLRERYREAFFAARGSAPACRCGQCGPSNL